MFDSLACHLLALFLLIGWRSPCGAFQRSGLIRSLLCSILLLDRIESKLICYDSEFVWLLSFVTLLSFWILCIASLLEPIMLCIHLFNIWLLRGFHLDCRLCPGLGLILRRVSRIVLVLHILIVGLCLIWDVFWWIWISCRLLGQCLTFCYTSNSGSFYHHFQTWAEHTSWRSRQRVQEKSSQLKEPAQNQHQLVTKRLLSCPKPRIEHRCLSRWHSESEYSMQLKLDWYYWY